MYSTNLVRRRLTPCLQSGWNWEVNDDDIWVGWDGKGAAVDPKKCGETNGGQVCGCQPESSDTYCSEAGWCGNSAAHQAKHQVDFSCGGGGKLRSAKPDAEEA